MNKKLITIGFIILFSSIILKLFYIGIKHIKIDKFEPSVVIFALDTSASNQNQLEIQKRYLRRMCSMLDPEDQVKILKVSEKSYLIYEGSAQNSSGIKASLNKFTKYNEKDYGTAYGEGLKKALGHSLSMQKEGYNPSIVILGDLENEGDSLKQINWDKLPKDVADVKKQCPKLSMMFAFAYPDKLDLVKEKLTPILGEQKLVIATDQTVDKALKKFLITLGR